MTKEGSIVHKFKVADGTGSIHLALFDQVGEAVSPGDILCISGGYASNHHTRLTLNRGRLGHVTKTGEFTMVFTEEPDMSRPQD